VAVGIRQALVAGRRHRENGLASRARKSLRRRFCENPTVGCDTLAKIPGKKILIFVSAALSRPNSQPGNHLAGDGGDLVRAE
jgi:hypothetical protein